MARHAFLLGGTGQIGRAVAGDLLDRGWRVTLASRGMRAQADDLVARGAAIATLDREEPGAMARALEEGADALIDTVAYSDAHADQLLEVERDLGSLVVISSASVYRDDAGRTLDEADQTGFPHFPQPLREDQATVEPGPKTYSTRKVGLERRLLDRARVPVTILRPCAIHGPHSAHPREWWFVKRMLDGRTSIPLAYRGESRLHTSAVENIAALIGTALERTGTRILNAADPRAPTVLEIGAAIARHMDYRGTFVPIDVGDDERDSTVGRSPWSIPAPFTLNTDAAIALGYSPVTSYEGSIGRTCDWLVQEDGSDWRARFPVLASYPGELFDYSAEDRALTAAPR